MQQGDSELAVPADAFPGRATKGNSYLAPAHYESTYYASKHSQGGGYIGVPGCSPMPKPSRDMLHRLPSERRRAKGPLSRGDAARLARQHAIQAQAPCRVSASRERRDQ